MQDQQKKLEQALLKKAVGFVHDEVIEEYSVDEDGAPKLIKKKVTKKFSPPDIPAIKMLFDVFDKQVPLEQMTEEELLQEKARLLAELEKTKSEQN